MSAAIITGASGGIGGELAKGLLRDWGVDELWLVARNEEKLARISARLREINPDVKIKIICADLGCDDGIATLRGALTEESPRLTCLVNAAGYGKFGTMEEISDEDAAGMIDVNSRATVLVTRMCVPYFERGGRIIQLGSGSCFTPLPAFSVYAASKIFVLHYTKALNYELKKYGVRATCFCPGWVQTDFFDVAIDDGSVTRPKSMKPMLDASKVARGCLRAAKKGKAMYVTNWYTKLQHLMFKLLPDPILTRMWLGMLNKKV